MWRTVLLDDDLVGHCAYLGFDDADDDSAGLGLLWDQVKACGINDPDNQQD